MLDHEQQFRLLVFALDYMGIHKHPTLAVMIFALPIHASFLQEGCRLPTFTVGRLITHSFLDLGISSGAVSEEEP